MLKTDTNNLSAAGSKSAAAARPRFPAFLGLSESIEKKAPSVLAGIAKAAACKKEFLEKLYLDGNCSKNDFRKAAASGREALKAAAKLGKAQHDEMAEWLVRTTYGYAYSAAAKKQELAPWKVKEAIFSQVYELRDSASVTAHENFVEKMQGCGYYGNFDGAIDEARKGVEFAQKRGNSQMAYDIALQAFRIALHRLLSREKDLDAAIGMAREARQFAVSAGRKTPEWLSEGFFLFAYRSGTPHTPAQVRGKVLSGIPEFATNHVAEMESLKAEIGNTIAYRRGEHHLANPKAAADLALKLAELSFLAPGKIRDANLQWILDTFRSFAAGEAARENGWTEQTLVDLLIARIPDIYF